MQVTISQVSLDSEPIEDNYNTVVMNKCSHFNINVMVCQWFKLIPGSVRLNRNGSHTNLGTWE